MKCQKCIILFTKIKRANLDLTNHRFVARLLLVQNDDLNQKTSVLIDIAYYSCNDLSHGIIENIFLMFTHDSIKIEVELVIYLFSNFS